MIRVDFGDRHVAKTGDIKEFTITEESGIAKGIRRIIGVTGEKAREAHQRCTDMQTRLDELKRLPDIKGQENAFKFFNLVSARDAWGLEGQADSFSGSKHSRWLGDKESPAERRLGSIQARPRQQDQSTRQAARH